MSTTPPDDPYGSQGGTPGGTPPSGPDYGAPPPSGPDYGAPPPSGPDYGQPPGGYGTPPPPPGGYGMPPGGYGTPAPGYGGGPANEAWSVGSALGYGWTKFSQNVGSILLLTLVVFVGSLVAGVVANVIQLMAPDDESLLVGQLFAGISTLISFLVQIVLGAIVVRAGLDLTEGRPLEIGWIWSRIPFGPVIVLGVLESIIIGVGVVLCFLPGLIAAFFMAYASYFLLDRNLSPVDALKASVSFVSKNLGSAFVWSIVAFIVTILGICLCVVGLLATIPIATIGTAFTYKKLTGQPVAS